MSLPPRTVTLVLCRPDGTVLGALPPFDVDVPWWQEVAPVVQAARERYGIATTILRLLHGAATGACGGPVTYLAETSAPATSIALQPFRDELPSSELRLPYAEPGGPQSDVRWALGALRERGRTPDGDPQQVRTWNLSSLWRLPTDGGAAWLKVVPPFFAHEGDMLARLDPAVVPPLLAHDGARLLVDELPGHDLYDADLATQLRMVALLVRLQAQWVGRERELLDLGLPDWRPEAFPPLAAAALERTADQLSPGVRAACDRLIADLPRRFAGVADCGVPDTLVHGDFHTGNLIGDDERLALLDWGDCGVGHPLLDRSAFLPRVADADRATLLAAWEDAWRSVSPGCDPPRAADLVAPVAALRQAVVYDTFLRNIEPSERVYHAGDPTRWFRAAVA